jgi:hypothetical protein
MYKYHHGLLPNIFMNFFTKNQDTHSYQTRNAAKLRTPLFKTQLGSNFIKNTGVKFWNILETSITISTKIGTFKTHLKKYINSTSYP